MKSNLININNFVDDVYFINLKRRKDRLIHIKSELKKHNIKANRFDAIDAKKLNIDDVKSRSGAIGALRSHRGVIQKALKKKQNIICVMEDDIILCDDFKERFDFYVKNVPKNWDMMYLGCHFHGCIEPTYIDKLIYKVTECFGCFAMILNNERGLFQKILDSTEDESKPVDNCIKDHILSDDSINAYVFKPFFVKTLDTISDISINENSFSYEVVNEHFEEVVDLVNYVPTPFHLQMKYKEEPFQKQIPQQIHIEHVRSNQEICEEYMRGNYPFEIFHNGRIIFDSRNTDKMNLNFYRDFFTLYGRQFNYQGMFIKRK